MYMSMRRNVVISILVLSLGIGNIQTNSVAATRCIEGNACSVLPPQPTNCTNPTLYSAPDDCNCLNWHCDELPSSERQATCPQGWNRYTNRDGETFCIQAFADERSWSATKGRCDNKFNADLFNVRRFEKFSENDAPLRATMIRDLRTMTNGLPHWSGLHITQGKLFWDSLLPSPDRDLTSTSESMVTFNAAQWMALNSGRDCVNINFQTARTSLQPEYCSGGFPFICYKEISADVNAYYKSTDGLLCGGDEGWVGSVNGGMCYKYFPTLLPFEDAQQECGASSANLADPRTAINQRFLTGMLSDLGNGSSPLSLHVGMMGINTSAVTFTVGGTIAVAKLHTESINSIPSATEMCGVLRNPYYTNAAESSGIIQFGNCSTARPFICSRVFSSQTISEVAQWDMEVVRNGYSLTCDMSGLDNLPGRIIWKKDHQYFPKQSYFSTISLTSAQYKYMIDDDTNRTIGHAELAGVYVCEFWLLYPTRQYRSPDVSVTFDDTTSLRISTELDEISWSSELGAFNYRVSQQDELSAEVQRVYNILEKKVQRALSLELKRIDSVQYGINILSLNVTSTNKVKVDYRITLTGEQLRGVQQPNGTSDSSDEFIQNILMILTQSELLNNSTTTSEPIRGQFACLQENLVHPQMPQNLSLPRTDNGGIVSLTGDCRGQETVMLTANCQYNVTSRLSSWKDLVFTDCPVDCFATSVTHSISRESFSLTYEVQGQNASFIGMCGRRRQEMVFATCEAGGWNVLEQECILMCQANQIDHPQLIEFLPSQEWPVNTAYSFNMVCDMANKTIVTAMCTLNLDQSDGKWTEVSTELCEVGCKSQKLTHPIGTEWNVNSSTLNQTVLLSGLCDNVPTELGQATCNGTLGGGAMWNVLFFPCDVKCRPQTFVHADTKGHIALVEGVINETTTINLMCNDRPLPISVQCQGNSSHGVSWILTNRPACSPSCLQTDWNDTITKQTYVVGQAKFGNSSTVIGKCGGVDQLLLIARCTGSIVTGVYWEFQTFNCSPSCQPLDFVHADTNTSFSYPEHAYDSSITLYGTCNGVKDISLATATCGGDITSNPLWLNHTLSSCIGYCNPLNIKFDNNREHYRLGKHEVGSVVEVNGTCALEPFVEATAKCNGDNENGGEWDYIIHRCGIDTTCPAADFVHPETRVKLTAGQTDPGVTVEVKGKCHGDEVTLLNVTCQAMTGGRGSWVAEAYSDCQTDVADQLSNLLENFKSDPLKLASYTAELSENLGNSSGETISLMVDIMEFVAAPETPKTVENEGQFFFDIVNNMMNVDLGGDKEGKIKVKPENGTESSGSRLAKSVEGFLDSANLSSSRISMKRANLFVEVIDTSALGDTEKSEVITDGLAVSLPQSVTNGSKLSFVKYDRPAMFDSSKPILGNTVFSASVADKKVEDSEGAISFTMKASPGDTLPDNAVCSYWNFTLSDWSRDGCQMIKRDNDSITCACNHLTNFAILLDIKGQKDYIAEEHHIALSVISTAGLSISIIALSLHLLSFMFIFKLRQNQFQKVLANLALSILISNIIFLVGIERTENSAGCIAIAALLHYFILASFAWMFVEAFMQYRRFVKVLGTHVTHILIKAGLPAWIVPAVPVAIVLIINPQLYRGGDRFCWMRPEPLYYSFLLPIGGVIVANIVLFALILRGLTCARPSHLRTNKSERDMRMMYFKAGLAIFTLLGLTWIFGFFAISDARLVFQYLFCITNAFQGLVIFLLHNIRDPKVVAWWRKVLHLKPLKPASRSLVSSSSYQTKKSGYSVSTSVIECDNSMHLSGESIKNKNSAINDCSQSISPITNRHLQLEQSRLIHSSTESDESCVTHRSETQNSDV